MLFGLAQLVAFSQAPGYGFADDWFASVVNFNPGAPMNTSRCRFSVRLLAFLTLLVSAGLATAVPQQVDYQGKLTDSSGIPFDGATSMVFRIWNHVTAGSVVWAETQATVNVESGLFHVNLGEVRPIPAGLFNTDGLYLSIQVGADAQMTPRLPMQSVPYAQTADYSLGPWVTSGTNVYRISGNVGIGRSTPQEALHVYRSSGDAKVKIHAFEGDADLVIENAVGTSTVEFRNNTAYGGAVGYDPVNQYMFLYHNGSLVFKNNRLGIGTNNPSTSLEVNGTVKVTGQCQGTFPRPNYDSGWVVLDTAGGTQDGVATMHHNLGGQVDNYVVDIVSRDPGGTWGINNQGLGSYPEQRGYFFANLTTSSIWLYRETSDTSSDEVRVRIWVYN